MPPKKKPAIPNLSLPVDSHKHADKRTHILAGNKAVKVEIAVTDLYSHKTEIHRGTS